MEINGILSKTTECWAILSFAHKDGDFALLLELILARPTWF